MEYNNKPNQIRVAVFATHPIQYQAPLWRRLAAYPEFDLHAYFGTDMSVRGYKDREFGVSLAWDTPLLEGYKSTFLSTDPRIQQVSFKQPTAKGLSAQLKTFNPDVGIMTAYLSLFHLGVWRALRHQGTPIIMRHEASDVAHARNGWKASVRDFILRRFYSRIDRFAVIGSEARSHLLRLGVHADRLGSAPYCVDSDFVAAQAEIWLPRREALRAEMGIKEGEVALLFSGKLIAKKDPLLIAAALKHLATYSQSGGRKHLIVAGEGGLRAELAAALQSLAGVQAHFLGFLNQREMGRAYAAADALVLPSRRGDGETWGLVVNEAMQYGLPAMVSDGVGCQRDMVLQGITGWVFHSGDIKGLAEAIQTFSAFSVEQGQEMKRAAKNRAATVTLDAAAAGLADAIRSVAYKRSVRLR